MNVWPDSEGAVFEKAYYTTSTTPPALHHQRPAPAPMPTGSHLCSVCGPNGPDPCGTAMNSGRGQRLPGRRYHNTARHQHGCDWTWAIRKPPHCPLMMRKFHRVPGRGQEQNVSQGKHFWPKITCRPRWIFFFTWVGSSAWGGGCLVWGHTITNPHHLELVLLFCWTSFSRYQNSLKPGEI